MDATQVFPRWGGRGAPLHLALVAMGCLVAAMLYVLTGACEPGLLVVALIGIPALVWLIRCPELALALFFNGQVFYFYTLFKLGMMPQTALTAAYFGLLIGAAIVGCRYHRRQRSRGSWLDLLFGTFLAWMLLSFCLLSPGEGWAVRKLSLAPVFLVAAYWAGRLLPAAGGFARFERSILAATRVLAVIFLYELLTAYGNQLRFSLFSFGAGVNRQDNPILVGITFAIPALLLYTRLFDAGLKAGLQNAAWIVTYLFLSIRAGSRGALLSLGVSLLFYNLACRRRFVDLVALALFGVAFCWAASQIPGNLAMFYQQTFENETASSVVERYDLWHEYWSAFLSSPVLGVGFGNLGGTGTEVGSTRWVMFAHNIFLETASELGLIGLALLVALLALAFIRGFRALNDSARDPAQRRALRVSLTLLVFALTHAQFSGHLTNQSYLWLVLGMVAGMVSPSKRRSRTGRTVLGARCSEDRVLGARCSVLGSDTDPTGPVLPEPSTEHRAPSTLSSEHRAPSTEHPALRRP